MFPHDFRGAPAGQFWLYPKTLPQGGPAPPLAAALKEGNPGRTGLVLSGGNIDLDLFRSRVLGAG